MVHQIADGAPSVGADHRHRVQALALDPAVDEDHGGAGAGGGQHHRGAAVGGADQQAVYAAVHEGAHMVVLEFGPLVGVADDHAVVQLAGGVLDRAGQLGEEGIQHVADDQPQGPGLIGAQRAGHRVGAVAEVGDRGEHPFTGVQANGGVVIEHP